jgi:hypothetical protein
MSRRVATKKAKFCSVCHAAGKSETEYTNHFVKSEPGANGVVICPTLLSQSCRYCHQQGHTTSHCGVLKAKQKGEKDTQRAKSIREFEVNKKQRVGASELCTPVSYGRFSGLDDECNSDDDEALQQRKYTNTFQPIHAYEPVASNAAPKNSVWSSSRTSKLFKASWADDDAWMSDDDE